MPSTFAWLDTSERDRRRAMDVIDLFQLRDTRDQLGLAGIRDAWADRLAPGTSTIQTRARYFFFVPWIYLALEKKGVSADRVARRSREMEIALIEAIKATDPGAVPIGAQVGKALRRLPSDIYWGGLGTLGIRLYPGSRTPYHRTFGQTITNTPGDEERSISAAWNPHLPPPPTDFPERASMHLEKAEAEFLRDQMLQRAPGSLLAYLVDQDAYGGDFDFAWEHPALVDAPRVLRDDIQHAQCFSLTMHGAALLYNLMLAEALPMEEKVDEYRARLMSWAAVIREDRVSLRAWDRGAFWRTTLRLNPRIATPSRQFAEEWICRVLDANDPYALIDDAHARQSIERRELSLKRNRARLTHREHLERWSGTSGANAIDYRYAITQRIVRDVMEGLGKGLGDT